MNDRICLHRPSVRRDRRRPNSRGRSARLLPALSALWACGAIALVPTGAHAAEPESGQLESVHVSPPIARILEDVASTEFAAGGVVVGPFCNGCDCDIDGSGSCDFNDVTAVLACFGSPPSAACPDIICDGIIDANDLGAILCFVSGGNGEQCCKGVTPKWTQLPPPNTNPPTGFNVPSDLDWQILAQQPPGQPGPGPNWVVADDFESDGRPITCVRWWGSYVDPAFEPTPQVECTCDLDGDGDCDVADLSVLLGCFGGPPGPGCPDYNCDGVVNDIDQEVWQCLADGNPPDVCCAPCPAPRGIDGWLISFHTDDVVSPPDFRRPKDLLGLYFCRADDIRIRPTPLFGWDGHRVFEYNVELEDCHLIHAYPDPRPGANPPDPARERKFLESQGFIYWLDIQAVVGHTYERVNLCPTCDCDLNQSGDCTIDDLLILLGCFGTPGCPDLNCDGVTDTQDVCVWECLALGNSPEECCGEWVEVPTDNFATDHFWGWHTSPDAFGGASTMSPVVMGPNNEWIYPDWEPVDGTPHELERVDQAFELLTPLCPADLNGNFNVDFADILVVIGAWGPCVCGPCPEDVDCSGDVGFSDILEIIANWGPCL